MAGIAGGKGGPGGGMKAPATHGGGKAPAVPKAVISKFNATGGPKLKPAQGKQPKGAGIGAQGASQGTNLKLQNSLLQKPTQPKPQPQKAAVNPYSGLVETNKQMTSQAEQDASSIYQPVISNLNSQASAASGLAAKRAADYQNFTTWAAGQQSSMMAQAAAQDQQYNNMMTQISQGMNNNEAPSAAAGLQSNGSTVSNMSNSTALGALAANQGAMNNSTTGALQSAAANMANNQSQTNAWGALSTATAANMQQQDQADYNSSMNTINQNLAQAQSDQINAAQSELSSLQSQNASNVKNESDYLQQQWANKQTVAQNNLAAKQWNLDYAQKQQEDLTSSNQWKAEQTTAANEWTATYNQKATEDEQGNAQNTINAIAAEAATNGKWTYDMVNQYNQALGVMNPGQKVTQYTPPKGQNGSATFQMTSSGRETQSEVNEHNAQAKAALAGAVTDRIKAQGALKSSLIENKVKLLAQQQDGLKTRAEVAELASEVGVHKAQMQNYVAEARKNLQEGNAAGSSGSTSTKASSTNPMTADEQTSWYKGVSDYQHSIATALSGPAGFKTITGEAPKKGPLGPQLHDWISQNYGKGNAQVWVAYDGAVGKGLTARTRQMAINAGVSASSLPPRTRASASSARLSPSQVSRANNSLGPVKP